MPLEEIDRQVAAPAMRRWNPRSLSTPCSLFNDKPSSVPQDDSDSSGDEEAAETRPRRPLRRSISSHPRFEDDSLRAARKAARAHEREVRRQQRGGIVPGFVKRLFGPSTRPQVGEYEPVRGDEH